VPAWPAQVNGYPTEEFTHAAVAATVASGMADAGFGIEAAASQHGLDFIPLATERYYLAARAATLERASARALLEALAGAAFMKRVRALPGYDAAGAGAIVSVREELGGLWSVSPRRLRL
jgi:molybdate-binding protein